MKAIGLVVVAGVACFVVSCGSALRDEPSTAPVQASAVGQRVFAEHCYQCHPGGAGGLAPAINNKPLPVWLMKTQVRVGLGAMPGFSEEKISKEELEGLMVYLKEMRGAEVKRVE
jgi:mono/diheme cytochrome c family protein